MGIQPALGNTAVLSDLWGRHPRDWAELQEVQVTELYVTIVSDLHVGPGMRLLDAGCGSGLFCRLAAEAGAEVAGIDGAAELLEIARERTPTAQFVHGDFEQLPWEDGVFDLVTAIGSFPYVEDPCPAMREAGRVVKPNGRVLVSTWGPPEQCEAGAILMALARLLPPVVEGIPGPFKLAVPAAMENYLADSGLKPERAADVACTWRYPSLEIGMRALGSGGTAAAALRHAGAEAVRAAFERGFAGFEDGAGGYRLENVFRYHVARPA
jgi:SAM-dependent methyltransferase